jgi:hypothetical protein
MAIDRDDEGLRKKSNARMTREKLRSTTDKQEVEAVLAERNKRDAHKDRSPKR